MFILPSLALLPKVGMFVDLSVIPLLLYVIFYLRKSTSVSFYDNVWLMNLLIIFFFIYCIAVISMLVNGSVFSEELLFKPVRMIIIISLLYVYFLSNNWSVQKLFHVIILIALINGLIIYVQYAFDYFEVATRFLYHPNYSNVNPYRKPGITAGFPTAGVLGAIGATISLYLFLFEKRNNAKYFFLFVLIVPSVILSSKMAILEMLMIIIILMFMPISFKASGNRIYYLWLLMVGLFCIFMYYLLNPMYDEKLRMTFNIMFAPFLNYYSTNSFSVPGGDVPIQLISLFPKSAWVLLIGNALPPFAVGGVHSDVSFNIVLSGNGIFSLLLYVLAYIYLFVVNYRSRLEKKYKILFFLIYLLVLIACFKGGYLFSRVLGDIVIILATYQFSTLQNIIVTSSVQFRN